ncbi:jg2775 [Pararge aegeria aegeria]|uniref:Jg2775 protein n=1 Tax=Pararge aegeria aegeria TaxID=348720 RepID=A0A8S4QQS9_9NEOP|nr:jg2775 [Pararge aegeria aegeria]
MKQCKVGEMPNHLQQAQATSGRFGLPFGISLFQTNWVTDQQNEDTTLITRSESEKDNSKFPFTNVATVLSSSGGTVIVTVVKLRQNYF